MLGPSGLFAAGPAPNMNGSTHTLQEAQRAQQYEQLLRRAVSDPGSRGLLFSCYASYYSYVLMYVHRYICEINRRGRFAGRSHLLAIASQLPIAVELYLGEERENPYIHSWIPDSARASLGAMDGRMDDGRMRRPPVSWDVTVCRCSVWLHTRTAYIHRSLTTYVRTCSQDIFRTSSIALIVYNVHEATGVHWATYSTLSTPLQSRTLATLLLSVECTLSLSLCSSARCTRYTMPQYLHPGQYRRITLSYVTCVIYLHTYIHALIHPSIISTLEVERVNLPHPPVDIHGSGH